MATAGLVTGVHHVAVRTTDYDKTVAFYGDVLGLPVEVAWTAADGRRLALLAIGGGSYVEVIGFPAETAVPEAGQQHPFMHLALASNDPDTIWQRATAAGYASVIDPKDVQLGTVQARIAFFEGPNGETIEIFHHR